MKTITNFTIDEENYESQLAASRYNPGLEVTFRDKRGAHTVPISAGYSDQITVYREKELTIVLSTNKGLCYAGVELFLHGKGTGELFLQTDYDIESVLGKNGLDKSSLWIAKTMANHIF